MLRERRGVAVVIANVNSQYKHIDFSIRFSYITRVAIFVVLRHK